MTVDSHAVLAAWELTGNAGFTLVGASLAPLAAAIGVMPPGIAWAITDPEGRIVSGTPPPRSGGMARALPVTSLPGTLHVFTASASATPASTRQALLLSVLAAVMLVLVAGWYFIWRGISREVQLAHQQSDFVAAVSHEFRSPLTSLGHIAELLVTDRVPAGARVQQSYQLILAESRRLSRMVEDLLEFNRLQSGRTTFEFADMPLHAFVGVLVNDFRQHLGGDSTRVTFAGEADVVVRADRDALSRALWNLLDNAVKYSPAGSPIHVTITCHPEAGTVAIAVADQGRGIPAGERDAVFDRFVRGAAVTAARINGTGIGLTIVREVMQAHRGRVELVSEVGVGSTFTLVLPVRPPAQPGGAPANVTPRCDGAHYSLPHRRERV